MLDKWKGRAVYLKTLAKPWLDYPKTRHDPLIPPPWLHNIGGGNFREVGMEFLGHFIELCGLKPTERVLDVGCGTGRMATALADYLTSGTFDGLEIVKPSVDWCNRAYSAHPNFHFHHADVRNERYNRTGSVDASEYRFPFPDGSFDFVFLTSVFTHMLPDAVRNYSNEIQRVLAPGGRALITAYLLNATARRQIKSRAAYFPFDQKGDGFYFTSENPEDAVAYEEADFLAMTGPATVFPGSWVGLDGTSWQDIVITHPKR